MANLLFRMSFRLMPSIQRNFILSLSLTHSFPLFTQPHSTRPPSLSFSRSLTCSLYLYLSHTQNSLALQFCCNYFFSLSSSSSTSSSAAIQTSVHCSRPRPIWAFNFTCHDCDNDCGLNIYSLGMTWSKVNTVTVAVVGL